MDVAWLASLTPFELEFGDVAELYGFPEFDAARIRSGLDHYFVGSYPALAQCLVPRKP